MHTPEKFADEVDQSEVGGYISFAKLENTMYKRRKLHTPQVPLNQGFSTSGSREIF